MGCTDGGAGGCGVPVDARWDTWSMRASTYTYCFGSCVVPWLLNNTASLGLGSFAGVVGVDHYWTHQGMPCVNGEPHELAMQDALTLRWKSSFPEMRFLQYRILSAVPYDMVVQDKILSDQDAVVRWRHQPNSTAPGNGSVCYNYVSDCFNNPKRINSPANNCSFEIRAAAYNWSNPTLASWFIDAVVEPAMVHADGIWLDGIGPDNGAYMCSGVCCGYGSHNSPLLQPEIDAHCKAQATATTAVQRYLIQRGGWEAQKCFDYKTGHDLPNAQDDPAQCASKLQQWARWAANRSNYNFVVAYGSRTGGRDGYNDTTVAGTVAAFLLMRGQHWLFSIDVTPGSAGATREGSLEPATARLLLSDYGKPLGSMSALPGGSRFQRHYERATVSLDCHDWSATFEESMPPDSGTRFARRVLG